MEALSTLPQNLKTNKKGMKKAAIRRRRHQKKQKKKKKNMLLLIGEDAFREIASYLTTLEMTSLSGCSRWCNKTIRYSDSSSLYNRYFYFGYEAKWVQSYCMRTTNVEFTTEEDITTDITYDYLQKIHINEAQAFMFRESLRSPVMEQEFKQDSRRVIMIKSCVEFYYEKEIARKDLEYAWDGLWCKPLPRFRALYFHGYTTIGLSPSLRSHFSKLETLHINFKGYTKSLDRWDQLETATCPVLKNCSLPVGFALPLLPSERLESLSCTSSDYCLVNPDPPFRLGRNKKLFIESFCVDCYPRHVVFPEHVNIQKWVWNDVNWHELIARGFEFKHVQSFQIDKVIITKRDGITVISGTVEGSDFAWLWKHVQFDLTVTVVLVDASDFIAIHGFHIKQTFPEISFVRFEACAPQSDERILQDVFPNADISEIL